MLRAVTDPETAVLTCVTLPATDGSERQASQCAGFCPMATTTVPRGNQRTASPGLSILIINNNFIRFRGWSSPCGDALSGACGQTTASAATAYTGRRLRALRALDQGAGLMWGAYMATPSRSGHLLLLLVSNDLFFLFFSIFILLSY